MRWYLNDASIQKQFLGKPDEFFKVCRELIEFRGRNKVFNENFFLTDSFLNVDNENIQLLLRSAFNLPESQNEFKSRLLAWLTNHGLFDFNQKIIDTNERVLFSNLDVTKSALGVATKNGYWIWKIVLYLALKVVK